ncbi:hypothetical protein ASF92_03205 [Pedobacter sp. Leaf176]|nr:hypothetical protein ASF92_03205 [Pedobacter sp. Leaf176]
MSLSYSPNGLINQSTTKEMKKITYAIMLLTITLGFGCKTNNSNLSIHVKDTETAFIYDAVYPVSKTGRLKNYIVKQLRNDLPVDQKVDTTVKLPDGERVKIKATEGALSIYFDKQHNSAEGFIKIKKFTDGVSEVLSER